jgi:hypothetical protein
VWLKTLEAQAQAEAEVKRRKAEEEERKQQEERVIITTTMMIPYVYFRGIWA